MRAVALSDAHRLEVIELDRPEPGPGEVLLRVDACGICGSDLTSYKLGLFSGVLGHEVGATVEAAGEGVDGLRAGDQVCVDPKVACGACEDCRSGHANRCVDALTRHVLRPGGYAEWLVAPAGVVSPLPAGVPAETGALAEPLSVAVHAVERAGVRPGEPALIVGLGSIGLLAALALRSAGAGPILAIEPSAERRELGGLLGVERTVPSGGAARGSLDRVPVVIECSGRGEGLQAALDMADSGGRVVMAGIPVAEVSLVPVFMVTRELHVLGSITSTRQDFQRALDLLAAHPEVREIVSPRLPLAQLPAVFERLAAGEVPPGKPAAVPALG